MNLNLKKILASLIFILNFAAGAAAQSSSVTGTMPDNGGSLPSTCQVGYIYSKTSAVGGAIGLYFCNPANILTAFPFTSNPFTSGGITINKIPKSDGASGLADGSCTDNTNITCTGVILISNGAVGAPAYSFSGSPTYGWWLNGTVVELSIAGAGKVAFSNQNLQMGSNGFILFTSTTDPNGTPDTMLTRKGAASFRFGSTDINGAPVAQTLNVQNAITGTDLPGADFTIAGPLGTGAGVPHAFNIQGANVLGTGTTAQSEVLSLGTRWFKALANNTVTTVANVTDASNTAAAVIVHYGIEIFDGTNLQWETGLAMCGVVNKAGAFAQNTCTKSGNAQGLGSGTLTVTWTITGANPALLQVNSNSSLTTTTNRLYYNIENLTNQAVTEQ